VYYKQNSLMGPSFGQALTPSVHRKIWCLLRGPRLRPKKWRKLRRLLLTAKWALERVARHVPFWLCWGT